MVQSEIYWMRNILKYDSTLDPVMTLFNNYFGGSMGSLVFQTIRESKALAYSTYAWVSQPDKKDKPYMLSAYVGCQADKFDESIKAMNELLTDLPAVEANLLTARASIKKDIETERIFGYRIMEEYLYNLRLGLHTDNRKLVYDNADKLTFASLKQFHTNNLSGKPYTYCIVASDKKLGMPALQKIGPVKKLTLTDIFGY
jgi:hypothetical protein